MSININETEMNELSMSIIMLAGNARTMVNDALMIVEKGNFDDAYLKLKDAKKEIAAAHSKQTKMIQGEAGGDNIPFSLLFAHAQDTLMVVMSEYNTANRLISLFKVLDSRLKKLEE
ncbi:PTS lactose/cellobiose transporter subunit IIA [Sinanaerobacter chloroacetimidivorans]|uniref:PTS lactose/cellobiose transporter subunit IIA n=1 Tax=Sinanaerobacter chloroacetimidivorans TaxID=2818044 RepID=A0A8J7W650_9FIRM|nr:PTS lactose/cellobiose transporter subunit IIA [Sinanaerobacter chloroacetimidivorans]MBR0599793.1 PTS lactose/cellobiose transporter subunit IIA [Sinanaerobacter chloroacetimidivorans]